MTTGGAHHRGGEVVNLSRLQVWIDGGHVSVPYIFFLSSSSGNVNYLKTSKHNTVTDSTIIVMSYSFR